MVGPIACTSDSNCLGLDDYGRLSRDEDMAEQFAKCSVFEYHHSSKQELISLSYNLL